MPCPDLQLSSSWKEAAPPPRPPEPPSRLGELRTRMLGHGPRTLDDAECLELLCELAEPAAPELIAAFGSLPEVLGAPAADLARVTGEQTAVRIKLIHELADRMLLRPLRRRSVLSSWSAVVAHLRISMVGGPREQFRVLFLDKRNRLIAVHVAVRSLGYSGERLNPKKADLEAWRQTFARELRERGVEAEATPRRARGVTRKPERAVIRRIRQRAEAGRGPPGVVQRAVTLAAARAAFGDQGGATPWETQLRVRQQRTRALYLGQARLLQSSGEAADRELGRAVEAFVREMPAPDTQRLALARALRDANQRLGAGRERAGGPGRGGTRGRDR